MKFRVFLLLILTISISGSSFSQKYINLKTYDVDSLHAILPDQIGEERIISLNYLAVSLSFIDFDSSMQYADEAMNLAKELDYEVGIAAAFRNYGQIYVYWGNYPLALNNYHKSLSLYEKLENKHTVGLVNYEIGKTHYFAGNYEKTIEYAYTALEIFRERTVDGTTVGNAKDTITIYGALGETYAILRMWDKSLEFDLKELDLMKRNNFKNVELMMATFHAGTQFYNMGEIDSAKVYFFKALAYPGRSLNMTTLKYRNNIHLGWLYNYAGKIDSALYYLHTANKYYNEKGFLFWALVTSNNLGYIHYKNNELNKAEKYYLQSERTFDEMLTKNSWYRHDSLKHIANIGFEMYFPVPPIELKEMMWANGLFMYSMLYKINKTRKRIDDALNYHIAYAKAKDTLNNLRQNHEIIDLQTKYETERHEEELENLAQENAIQELKLKQSGYFLFGLGALVIIVILIAVFIIRLNKLRDQQKTLLLQQKLFRSQMNPHFIFNSLTSIQNHIMDEEAHQASKYLSRFSKLIRHILDSSVEEYVTLEEEISTIENYLELQKIRFKNKFDYTIEVDDKINPENVNIPPMLAQPFIENSIEHGIKNKKVKGNIYIRFYSKNNHIVFEVEDDGVGRKKAQEILYKQNKDHKSLATAITYERIRVLNKKLKKKITLLIRDLKSQKGEPTGTKVVMQIPII